MSCRLSDSFSYYYLLRISCLKSELSNTRGIFVSTPSANCAAYYFNQIQEVERTEVSKVSRSFPLSFTGKATGLAVLSTRFQMNVGH